QAAKKQGDPCLKPHAALPHPFSDESELANFCWQLPLL
ncbi:uncharacterized protein METZ01_LOCUS390350, partial [marine metagenome]